MTTDSKSNGQDGDRLDSWKEIAAYLGKDVRTALRWSKDGNMPVYRHAGSNRGAVYAYRSEIDEWIHSDRSEPPRLYQKPVFKWAVAVAILVLVATIATFSFNHSTKRLDTPVRERVWVLITDFDSRSGDGRLDGTVETALRRELADSRHVLVVAPERLRDTLALMKREPGVTVDRDLGREVCLRIGGKCALLAGRVEKFDSSYLLSVELVDSANGRTLASTTEQAEGQSGILPAVHRLSTWLRGYMGEELSRISFDDAQFEKVTTPSLRALEIYSRGMQAMYLYRWTEAETLFRKAVMEDQEFASANLFVFWALANQGKGLQEEAQSFLKRAMALGDSATEQERIFIDGTFYWLSEKNFEKACESYKLLAELFPDHYWAAGNAVYTCGNILGRREEYIRYSTQAAEMRIDLLLVAAKSLSYLAGEFDQARPYVERLNNIVADGGVPGWKHMSATIAFNEFFAAEEMLAKGALAGVESEVKRIELMLKSLGPSRQPWLNYRLANFYLTLGQFGKVRALAQEKSTSGQLTCWLAFMEGDQTAFAEGVEEFHARNQEVRPDPSARLDSLLVWNMYGTSNSFPLDALAPLYDPASIAEMASSSGMRSQKFLSWPKFEAKLQLVQGKHLLNQGRTEEAMAHFKSGIKWLQDQGDWAMFSYYFLGTELLASTLTEQGDSLAAYSWLREAADQRQMVNSLTASLHQRIQAQRALLARELGYIAEAEMIETELKSALRLADPDHPILVQIGGQ